MTEIFELCEQSVFTFRSTDILFNQYRDRDPKLDQSGAAETRRENLRNYLSSFSNRPRVLLVGEAPGPWGGRFSGVPFTGEKPLSEGSLPFTGKVTSTSETPYQERAGNIFWDALSKRHAEFLIWNSVPFHPHRKGLPLSIRKPSVSEVTAMLPVLERIIVLLNPEEIVAIGRTAESAVERLGKRPRYVRHPSHGGITLFREGMQELFQKKLSPTAGKKARR